MLISLNCNIMFRAFLTHSLYTSLPHSHIQLIWCISFSDHELLSSYMKKGNWMDTRNLENSGQNT